MVYILKSLFALLERYQRVLRLILVNNTLERRHTIETVKWICVYNIYGRKYLATSHRVV